MTICANTVYEEFMGQGGGERLLHQFLREHWWKGASYDDVAQELRMRACHALALYNPSRVDTKVSSYVWKSWENSLRMVNRAYRASKRTAETVPTHEVPVGALGGYTEDVLGGLVAEENSKALQEAIEDPATGLTEREKLVVQLTLMEISQNEMRPVVGVSQSEISKSLTSAKEKLRVALEARGVKGVE